MQVPVHFYSYFKELTGCAQVEQALSEGANIEQLIAELGKRFPKWAVAERSALIAVGLEYQTRDYVIQAGDEVSLFPPVQGG